MKQIINFVRAKKLYLSGMTQCEVAKEMNTTQRVIWRLFKKNKLEQRKAAPRNQRGVNNNNWKGSDVGYSAYHRRMESQMGKPKKCEVCGTDDIKLKYDWANLTGKYNDPKDFKRMCRSCHWKYDKKILNIKHMKEKNDAGRI